VVEDYFCSYGLNPAYREPLEHAGLRVTGIDDEGEVRIVELEGHPFFMGTLFCFQTRSRPGRPHPIVSGFVAASESSWKARRRSARPSPTARA
jgi:CTP synthase (UTP-ammonia lyase)